MIKGCNHTTSEALLQHDRLYERSTAPQAFFRPDRVLSRPARADAVKAGRSSAAILIVT
jgi:hypothetical protein